MALPLATTSNTQRDCFRRDVGGGDDGGEDSGASVSPRPAGDDTVGQVLEGARVAFFSAGIPGMVPGSRELVVYAPGSLAVGSRWSWCQFKLYNLQLGMGCHIRISSQPQACSRRDLP